MPRCKEILESIFARTGLNRLDGHPLYSYKITAEELNLIRHELQNRIKISATLRTTEERAAFCLFSAEWFRKSYISGPWKWDVIFEGLGCRKKELTDLYDHVSRGLRWWCVDIIATELSLRYLTSLVCQGGFPLNTLKNEGAGLSRLLKSCLKDHERYPSEPLSEIISKYIEYIPETLNNPEVRNLTRELVQVIAKLRELSDSASSENVSRYEFLEQHHPGWDRSLPLRIEDPEAKELLLSLLDASKSQPYENRTFSLTTTLKLRGDKSNIIRTLRYPSSLTDEEFSSLCDLRGSENILPRMVGFLKAGEIRSACVNIARSHDGTKFRLNSLSSTSLSGDHTYKTTSLLLVVGGKEINKINLPGGEALPDSPWIFTGEEPYQLIGVGSVCARDSTVIVALPENCSCKAKHDSIVEEMNAKIGDRTLVKVSGEISLSIQDSLFRIKTSSPQQNEYLYELRGRKYKLGTGGSDIWIGPPKAFQIPALADAPAMEIPHDQLQWKPCSGGNWNSELIDCLGSVFIRVKNGDDTFFMTRITVFPHAFSLRVFPGDRSSGGRLRLKGLGDATIYPDEKNDCTISISEDPESHFIDVETQKSRPSLISARIRFHNGLDCDVNFVCPTKSVAIIDAVGNPLHPNQGIPVERINGLTLQVIQPETRTPIIYECEYHLPVDSAKETRLEGVWELPLSYIRNYASEILSLSDDPDSDVEFEVSNNHGVTSIYKWKITRYGWCLKKISRLSLDPNSKNNTDLSVEDNLLHTLKEGQDLELSVSPLGRPSEAASGNTILKLGTGRWKIDHSDYDPGYYLAVAKLDDNEVLRPIRFVVKPELLEQQRTDPISEEEQFDHILEMYDSEERRIAWDEYIDTLVKTPGHPGWSRIDELVNASQSLPITTFEAVAALTRNPQAVARIGILHPHKTKLWRRLEELPFLWSLIPVESWISAANQTLGYVHTCLEKAGYEPSKIENLIIDRSNLFAKEAPKQAACMSCIVGFLWSLGFKCDPSSFTSYLQGMELKDRELEHARLLRHHSQFDTRIKWPDFLIDYNSDVREILKNTKGLLIKDIHKNQWAVLNGPAVAAVYSVYGFPLNMNQLHQFKRLRAIDTEWYDKANLVAQNLLIKHRVSDCVLPFTTRIDTNE